MSLAKAYKSAHGGYPGAMPEPGKVLYPGARIEVTTEPSKGLHVFNVGQRGTLSHRQGGGWVVMAAGIAQWLEPEDFRLV